MNSFDHFERLSRRSVKAWRFNGGLWSLAAWIVPAYLGVLRYFGSGVGWWLIGACALAALLVSVLLLWVVPEVLWRQWQYRVDQHEIDLHHGIWFTRRTLVPVRRVQHVDTRQGPVLRYYGLADVVISTAATTHKIPALDEDKAEQVRSDISAFARQARDDV